MSVVGRFAPSNPTGAPTGVTPGRLLLRWPGYVSLNGRAVGISGEPKKVRQWIRARSQSPFSASLSTGSEGTRAAPNPHAGAVHGDRQPLAGRTFFRKHTQITQDPTRIGVNSDPRDPVGLDLEEATRVGHDWSAAREQALPFLASERPPPGVLDCDHAAYAHDILHFDRSVRECRPQIP